MDRYVLELLGVRVLIVGCSRNWVEGRLDVGPIELCDYRLALVNIKDPLLRITKGHQLTLCLI